MRTLLIWIFWINLTACSFGGFKPPVEKYGWRFDGAIGVRPSHPEYFNRYLDKREKDMRACGLDPFVGYHISTKQGLCMEAKGWYYTAGPVCEEFDSVDNALCVEWRKKRNLPYPSPDKIHR